MESAFDWRKPESGMLEAAIRDHDVDRKRAALVGDSSRDIEAGRAAGLGFVIQYGERNLLGSNRPPNL